MAKAEFATGKTRAIPKEMVDVDILAIEFMILGIDDEHLNIKNEHQLKELQYEDFSGGGAISFP